MIFQKTKLTSSAGIGPNKLVAKIASEINKPNGQLEVTPNQVSEFMMEQDASGSTSHLQVRQSLLNRARSRTKAGDL
jgi:hypothetical protein